MRVRWRPAFVIAFLFSAAGAAQNLDFSVSPSPVGSGARAAGMADAFVAVADDATAASWNPAGLVQLERPEVSVVGAFNLVHENLRATDERFFETSASDFGSQLNFLSFTYPLPVTLGGRNATLSISYQRKYDFGRNFNLDFDLSFIDEFGEVQQFRNFDFEQSGGLATISPAFAMELTKKLSVGVTVNFWRSSFISQNDWERTLVVTNEVTTNGMMLPTSFRRVEERYDGLSGENVAIGVLWNPTQHLSLGFRYDTEWTGDVDFSIREFGTITPLFEDAERNRVTFPASFTLGAASRINDRLTVALDWTHTDWSEFVLINEAGVRRSLITGEDVDAPGSTLPDPTNTVRIGAEYVFVPKEIREKLKQLWTVRGGVFFDQEPASNRPTGTSGLPGDGRPDRFWGLTVGGGVQAFQRVNFDFAYQARFGLGVDSDRINGLTGFEEDVVQHRFLLSAVVYF